MKRIIPFILIGILLLSVTAGIYAAASTGGKEPVNPKQVQRDLKDILSRPEYDCSKSWLDIMLEKVQHALGQLLKRLVKLLSFNIRDANDAASLVFSLLVIAGFIFFVVKIMQWVGWSGRLEDADEGDPDDFELPSAKPLIKQAAQLAATGNYRAAFRCAYLASISHLDEIGALRFERSRTNWEYLRDLKLGGFEGPHNKLQPLTLDFDRVFYGRDNCDNREYEKALSAYESISRGGAK